jgi:ABC-2 type transport system ATP-binding protein
MEFAMQTTLLHINNVTKSYVTPTKNIIKALHGVELSINQGEIVSLLGVNGAGKTTLSSIIATLIPATSGDVFFQGQSIYADIPWYRSQLGLCPQRPNFNQHLTLEKNLYYAGLFYGLTDAIINERISALAEQFELNRYLKQYPNMLSGGYKQRFLIARTLMHNPKLVIFDEPTVALDPHVRHELWESIKQLKEQNISVVLTTHYLDEAEVLSDRVCLLHHGVIKLIDTPANLINQHQKEDLEAVFIELINQAEDKK